jgi:hypothetical protein
MAGHPTNRLLAGMFGNRLITRRVYKQKTARVNERFFIKC